MNQTFRSKRSWLLFAALLPTIILSSEPIHRVIILADDTDPNPALQTHVATIEADFRTYFGVSDIHVISVKQGQKAENIVNSIEEGLQKVKELCQDSDKTTVLAFAFSNEKGPSLSQVEDLLSQSKGEIKILSNAYFRSSLTNLGCGGHAVMEYSRGLVQRRDTIVDERGFPIIPVLAGTAAAGVAIVLLSGKSGEECETVSPSWLVPNALCVDDAPIQLIATGTNGGNWSGTGVTPNGLFNPANGTQNITYTVGEGACRQSQSHAIEVGNANASWTPPAQSCEGQTITLQPMVTGGTWTGPGVTQNPNGTASFIHNDPGNYSVTYSITSGLCSASVSQNIIVLPDADASWTVSGSICAGETIELIPSGTTGGTWSGPGVTDHGNGTASFSSNTTGEFDITYTAGTGECAASLTQQIEVHPTPIATWSPPKEPGCVGQQFLLLPNGTQGGSWSGPGVVDHGDGTATFSHNTPGTYSITYTATLGNCIAFVSHDITVIHQADASWTLPSSVCTGNEYTLAPTGTPGGTWTGDGVTDNGNGTASIFYTESGEYALTYTAGIGECESSLTQQVFVTQTPDASWPAPSNALCTGDTYELIPSGTTGGIWSGNGVADHGNGTATFSHSKAGQYEVTFTATNGSCSNSLTQAITVIAKPDASWTAPSNVCAGSQVTLIPTGTMGGTWSGSDVTDLGDGTALFMPGEAGLYNITYTIGQGSCEATFAQDVQVYELPDASWSIPTGTCAGQVVTLIPEGTQGGNWSGEGITDLGNGTATFSQDKPGIFEITYTVTTGPCSSTLSQNIEVVSLPDPSWTIPSDVCEGQVVALIPDGTIGGTWSGTGVTDQGNGTAQFVQKTSGTYPVTYTVGQGSCMQSLSQDIVVIDAGDPSWTPPSDIICPGTIIELVSTEGTWSGDGVTDLGGGLGEFQTFNPGVYNITLTVGSGNCTASETHDVEVADVDPPVIEVPASDINVSCDGSGNMSELQDWLDSNGGAEASDNCSGTVTWEHDFIDFPFDCGMSGSTTVTFTATDDEGNTATTIGVFTIEDFDPPEFQGVPSDITVPCENIPPPATVTATDQCSADVDVVFEELPPGTSCPYEIIRTWSATDDCGNETSAQQTITATDNQPPQPQSIPHDTIINCPGPPEQCIPPPQQVEFTDNCDSDPTVQMMEEIQQMPGMIIIIRCWTATDDCGNMSPPVCQQIHIFGEGGNIQQQVPEISLSIAPSPGLSTDLHSLFVPSNALWKDPGLTVGPQDIPGELVTFARVPPITFGLELALESGVSLLAGAGWEKAELFRLYQGIQDDYILSGLLNQQTFHLGLRFIPEKMKNVYFITGAKYFRSDISDIRLHHSHYVTPASTEIRGFSFSQFIGTGIRFEIGDIGHLNIASSYSPAVSTTLSMQIELNINQLLSHRAKL